MVHELPLDQLSSSGSESGAAQQHEPPSLIFWGIWALIFVAGALFAVGLWFQDAVPAQRINSVFLPSECTVLDKRVEKVKVRDFNPGKSAISNDYEDAREFGYSPSVRIRYSVAGTQYEIWTFDGGAGHYATEADALQELEGFRPGESYRCWYDPDDPAQAVIRRLSSYRQNYTGVVAAGLFGLLGLGGLLYCAKSALKAGRR